MVEFLSQNRMQETMTNCSVGLAWLHSPLLFYKNFSPCQELLVLETNGSYTPSLRRNFILRHGCISCLLKIILNSIIMMVLHTCPTQIMYNTKSLSRKISFEVALKEGRQTLYRNPVYSTQLHGKLNYLCFERFSPQAFYFLSHCSSFSPLLSGVI